MSTAKPVREFVKYRNRKLHEVGDGNPYTTMEELLAIVAGGDKVRVIEDESGKDITSYTLTRLIYDRARMDHDVYKVQELQKLIMSAPPDKAAAA